MAQIVSASRRTDIPAFYLDWFLHRARAGFCDVPNPFNPHQVRRVPLDPGQVDGVVFWTKDAAALLGRIREVDALGLPYYVLFTLNPYPVDLEPRLPSVESRLETFRALARHVGPRRVIWRYDPIILSNRTPHGWHAESFARMARALQGSTRRVVISLLDYYRKVERRLRPLEEKGWRFVRDADDSAETHRLVRLVCEEARRNGMEVRTCAESVDFSADGAPPGACIDGALVREEFGAAGHEAKDPHQRATCGCVESRDIGVPDTCLHGCPYCYATRDDATAHARRARHDPRAPALWSPAEQERPEGDSRPPGPPSRNIPSAR